MFLFRDKYIPLNKEIVLHYKKFEVLVEVKLFLFDKIRLILPFFYK